MTDTALSTETTESVADFGARARTWLAENMPRIDPANPPFTDRGERGVLAAGKGTAEAPLFRRLRRHLLPP